MKNLTVSDLKTDCRAFRGDIPCKPHKEFGVHCVDAKGKPCAFYDPADKRILVIKLGAIGDVIRTTPLLHRLKKEFPHAEVWWLTLTPDMIPSGVDVVLPFTAQSMATLLATSFDILYCLDKDKEACALASMISAEVKKGYTLKNGKCIPLDASGDHKFLTGAFDDISKSNIQSYQEEIFEICGFKFQGEEYIMREVPSYDWKLPRDRKIVGLNTGCGGRWTSRLWPDEYWIELAIKLREAGQTVLLLGGEQEHEKNLRLASRSGALYPGHFPLPRFTDEVRQCDCIVTAVTMGMHLAIGLKKRLVLFNNIFNRNEFELYNRGVILEPDFDCDCFYSPTCPNNCMQYLRVGTVFDACQEQLSFVNHE